MEESILRIANGESMWQGPEFYRATCLLVSLAFYLFNSSEILEFFHTTEHFVTQNYRKMRQTEPNV